MIVKYARTREDFARIIEDRIRAQRKIGQDELDHTAPVGVKTVLQIEYLGDKFDFHANNKLDSLEEFLVDFRASGIAKAKKTQSKWRCEASNRRHSPRVGLYIYQ
jgi:hypothetical protein